ncbi:HAD-superfamily hydrolase, subfamily IA, variant 3 [Thermobaculum terrenum ATCC BAA-798]|uniref:HAD-superfamily hydrolase, subfamily IA, variant 3 n=1 Tax=Thermobaculum terrenum (strain ATCC BAA-798 / CCMEE 7001 / YNP1) TaxID=525904 RepID=D1CFT7_THET1|nr:HAD family phosphatase [Thermobaculum terrenum]ACZ41793.1 HAD-superfamily hydrolase, subfamily IA, variant 3 [Thermobaculum terrenum ATCC BAA-798]
MEKAAVLWDLDGVLVDSRQFHYESWLYVAHPRSVEISYQDFLPTFGMRNPDAIRVLFGDLPEEEINRIAEDKERYFRKSIRGRIKPLPGAYNLVVSLHANGHKQAIASSTPRLNIEAILAEIGLEGCFDEIVSGDDVKNGKPNPDIFLLAAEKLGVDPRCCVVVEDAVVGVQAGKAAGMKVFAVAGTRRPEDLRLADRIVHSLEELSLDDFQVDC